MLRAPLLISIILLRTCCIPRGVTASPTGVFSGLDFSTFGAPFLTDSAGVMGIGKALTTPVLLVFAFSLMMSDFFDTMGSAMAIAKQGDFLTEDGSIRTSSRSSLTRLCCCSCRVVSLVLLHYHIHQSHPPALLTAGRYWSFFYFRGATGT